MSSFIIQVTLNKITQEQSDILVALLAGVGFYGFEESENILKACISEDLFSEKEVISIAAIYHITYEKEVIAPLNWNETWEKNFEPVIVDDFAAVRAGFHAPIKNVEHEIIITPKMSFGTGHHATTHMMMQQMRKIDFRGKTVFDFGTGTGILAILADKLGAEHIAAIDNDEWSILNAIENAENNSCSNISITMQHTPPETGGFDIILANINKNVILTYLSTLSVRLNKNGQMILSGLLPADEAEIVASAKEFSFNHIYTFQKENWLCIGFSN